MYVCMYVHTYITTYICIGVLRAYADGDPLIRSYCFHSVYYKSSHSQPTLKEKAKQLTFSHYYKHWLPNLEVITDKMDEHKIRDIIVLNECNQKGIKVLIHQMPLSNIYKNIICERANEKGP